MMNLASLTKLLLSCKDEDTASEHLEEFLRVNEFDEDDVMEELASNYNCCKCSSCGRFLTSDMFSDDDVTCVFCCEDENEDEDELIVDLDNQPDLDGDWKEPI